METGKFRCPVCGSKRVKRFNRQDEEFICGKCRKGFVIYEFPVPECDKCERLVTDWSKAVEMGSGKTRHRRCRRMSPRLG